MSDEAVFWRMEAQRHALDCDVCGLPDLYGGQGDGIGSCECSRCDGGEAADSSVLCICTPDDDEYATLQAAADLDPNWPATYE